MKKYKIFINGTNMGIYAGDTEEEALDILAKDAGYKDYEDLEEQIKDQEEDFDFKTKEDKIEIEEQRNN